MTMTIQRRRAVAGAVVAVGAATLMGLSAGLASASVPGECTENVNVRAEPSVDSRIVALCEAGTAVLTGEVRDGFVRITDLGGWAAEEYIAVDSATPQEPPTAPADDDVAAPGTTGPAVDEEDELRALPADGAPSDRTTEDGTTDDGTTDDGTTDDGTTSDGTTSDGTTSDGTTDDGTTDGTPEGVTPGGTDASEGDGSGFDGEGSRDVGSVEEPESASSPGIGGLLG